MGKICQRLILMALVVTLVLTACVNKGGYGSPDPAAEKTCVEGVCAEINITQPIILDQPTEVTITINSTVYKPGLLISLVASPSNVFFGPDTYWQYDAVPKQSQVFNTTVTFITPGGYQIAAEVFWNHGPLVENFDRVVIDSTGAVVNPTFAPRSVSRGYPVAKTPPPEVLTAQADPEITLAPPPQLAGFTPQQWLDKCGWAVNQPEALSELQHMTGWLNIQETVEIGEQVNGTLAIGFKDEENRNITIQTQIGICPYGQSWTAYPSHEWNTELNSGIPFIVPVSLHFNETGNIPIFIVVLDKQNNRTTGIGRLINVKPRK